jgi:hypothetical protein
MRHRHLGLVAGLATAILALAGAVPANIDDAFTVLVYARHLARGGAIEWNAGAGHVDGFTSVLDMSIKALSILVAPGDPVRNAHIIAIAAYLASVVLGGVIALRAAPHRSALFGAAAAVGALAFGANLALAQATSYLLETPLFALAALAALATALFARAATSRVAACAAAAQWTLLGLARPEGIPIAMLLAAASVHRARGAPRRRTVAAFVAFLLVLGAYGAWHLAYFGHLAPNTFYAKSSDSRWNEIVDGALYVREYATTPARTVIVALLFVAPAAALTSRIWASVEARRRFAIASACALLLSLEVVVEGGDTYGGGRFLAVPIALLLAALIVGATGLRRPWALAPLGVLALYAIDGCWRTSAHLGQRLERIRGWPTTERDFACEKEVADFVAARVDTASETDFQRLKYFEDRLVVIDLSGLSDVARAHASSPGHDLAGKGGAAEGPRVDAEVMQLGTRSATRLPMARYSAADVVRSEPLLNAFLGVDLPPEARDELVRRYVTMSVPVCGVYVNLFVRKDRVDRFVPGALVGASSEE